MGRGPSFNPQPFAGTHAPPGASPEALHELEKMKQTTHTPEAPTEKPESTPTQSRRSPRSTNDVDADADATPRRAARSTARRSNTGDADEAEPRGRGRAPKEDRAQRVIRLSVQVDAKLRQLAEFRGVDLNAAASVAIAEDWRRCFGSQPDRS